LEVDVNVLKPGVHLDVSETDYHADPAPAPSLSSSIARTLLDRSPLHAWTQHPRLNPAHEPQDRKTFDIGRAAHRCVLGRGGDYEAIPSDLLASNGAASTKGAKEWIADARERGVTPLKADEVDTIGDITAAVSAHLAACRIKLDPSRSEAVALAEIDGVWCRAMIDNAPADPRLPLYDLKTTTDASPDAVIRAVCNYGYDVQAAHYLATWKAATGEDRRFRFVFVEKEAPFGCCVVELDGDPNSEADWLANANSKASESRRIWGECLNANEWPGYPAAPIIIGAPVWHARKWEDREIGLPVTSKPAAAALSAAHAMQAP
jgi:hypothetical protein